MSGIVCLEGSWGGRLTSGESIEPALRCLEAFSHANVIHKDVATEAELEHYLDQWLGREGRAMPNHEICMLAFHGSRQTLHLGRDDVSLEKLVEIVDGRAADKIFYMGGCGILNLPDEALMDFCRETGAKGVVGYTKVVDYIETSAFEMLLLNRLLEATNFKPVYTRLRADHPEWTRKLGLRMARKDWASERRIAIEAG